MADWIEIELQRQLRPVVAPDALWDRIHSTQRPAPRVPAIPAWRTPVLAALVLLISGGLFLQLRNSRASARDIAQFTDQELQAFADPSTGQTFPSDNPTEIRNWIKARGNMDVELPDSRSTAIRLLGAKLIRLRGAMVAAVAYSIGGESATLLVSRRTANDDTAPGTRHLISKVNTSGGRSLFSWEMRQQTYTIAYAGSGDPQGGCLLCHADPRARL